MRAELDVTSDADTGESGEPYDTWPQFTCGAENADDSGFADQKHFTACLRCRSGRSLGASRWGI